MIVSAKAHSEIRHFPLKRFLLSCWCFFYPGTNPINHWPPTLNCFLNVGFHAWTGRRKKIPAKEIKQSYTHKKWSSRYNFYKYLFIFYNFFWIFNLIINHGADILKLRHCEITQKRQNWKKWETFWKIVVFS